MNRVIDLNADMGEYADDAQRDIEAALMPMISSCSIACGGHAGDETTMKATARLAHRCDVSIGAHPAYPDREGFGRRSLSYDANELTQNLAQQISALKAVLDFEKLTMKHVKPHGALYNDAAKDERLAVCVIDAVKTVQHAVTIVGPPGSMLEAAARAAGFAFAAEGFVDRLYQANGALTPRGETGAVIADIAARARQALAIARGDSIEAADGKLQLNVRTLCIHSDSPGAVETASATRAALERDSVTIRAFE